MLAGSIGIVVVTVLVLVVALLILREMFGWYSKANEQSRLLVLVLLELRKANGTKEPIPKALKGTFERTGVAIDGTSPEVTFS